MGNRISSLAPGVFWGVGNLRKLDLEDNQISSIGPNTFTDMPQLYKLNIMRKLPQNEQERVSDYL
jgi:G protein-coupled receptor 124